MKALYTRFVIKDGPVENLWGKGGGSTKKISHKGKLNEKFMHTK